MASALQATSKSRRAGRNGSRPGMLKRSSSGSFLSGLKSFVVTPFAWLNGGGDKDTFDEEMEEEEENVGAKRQGGFNPDSPARKRLKKTSPSTTSQQQHNPTGYLDPPVLRDSTYASNVGPRSRLDLHSHTRGIQPPVSILTDTHRDAPWVFSSVPHAPSLPVAPAQDFTALAPENRAIPPRGSVETSHSFTGGARRPSHLIPNGFNPPLRRQPSSAHHDYSQVPRSLSQHAQQDQAMRSPMDGTFKPQSRSPSVGDLRSNHSPIRMSATLRMSGTPHRLTALPATRGSAAPGIGGLYRRSSSMMNLDAAASQLQRQSSSQVMFDPKYGITTQEEVSARDPPAPVPRNNAERILLALEQATPLTEARRLRLSQKAAFKVPIPSPAVQLKGKAARMVAPYARPSSEKVKQKADDIADGPSKTGSKASNSFLRYLGKQAKAREAKAADEKASKIITETSKAVPASQDDDAMVEDEELFEPKASEKTKAGKGRDAKGSDSPAPSQEKAPTMPGRTTSSLRAGRTLTHRTHIPSTRPTNKFSARFDDEDDEDNQEDASGLTSDELKAWTDRGGGTLEVPAGFSFDKIEAPKSKTPSSATEDYKASVEREADIRAELYKKLRGGAPVSEAFFVPLVTKATSMPQVPQQPFIFAGKPLPGPVDVVPVSQPAAPPTVPEPKPSTIPEISKPSSTSQASASPSLNFAIQRPLESIKNPGFTSPTTDGPVKSLPFSFSSIGAAPKAATPTFQLTAPVSTTVQPSAPSVPANNLFQRLNNAPSSGGSTSVESSVPSVTSSTPAPSRPAPFSFGPVASFGTPANPSSMPVLVPSTIPSEPVASTQTRSSAPSPSPSPFANIGLGHPSSAAVNQNKPTDSVTKSSDPTPFAFGAGSAKPPLTQDNASTPAVFKPFSNNLFSATPLPSTATVGTAQEPKAQVPSASSIFGRPSQEPQPTPSTTTPSAPPSDAPPPLFGNTASSLGAGSFSSSSKPAFSFGTAAPSISVQHPQAEAPAAHTATPVTTTAASTGSGPLFGQAPAKPASSSPFAFGAASSKPAESSPFSFNIGAPKAPTPSGFGTLPSSGTPAPGLLFGVSKPKTPPPHDGDMMEESSPTREVAPAPSSTGFSFGKSAGAPGFSFSLQPGTSSPFATSTSNKTAGGFFGNSAAPSSPSAPFGQPTPASPFGSQPNSPFVSPAQGLPAVNSMASSAPPIPAPVFGTAGSMNSFGSGQSQGGNAFSFSTASNAGVTSPSQANATVTTPSAPTFVFGAGSQPSSPTVSSTQPGGRPVARLPRRAGSTTRRGASGTR